MAAPVSSFAASRIEPAAPTAFELVNLRLQTDSCTFNASTVRVRAAGGTIRVTQDPNLCFAPGNPIAVDIRLGELPAGDYRVEVYASPDGPGVPAETLAFTVSDPAEIAVFPPPPKPLTDYTGIWWNPQQSGWGLSLHQSPTHGLFGSWFVYGPSSDPVWYTLQSGRWLNATTWTGTVYRTTGPSITAPQYDPRQVLVQTVGTATLDFALRSGEEGSARFTVDIDGSTTTRTITRMRY